MTQLGFFVDVSKCSGCKTCAVACKDAHNLPVGMNFRKVHEYAGGNWKQAADGSWTQDVFGYYVSLGCNHCSDPACVRFARQKHITNVQKTVWWSLMRRSASAADFVHRLARIMHRYWTKLLTR